MVLSTRTHTMNGLLDEVPRVYQWWRGSWRASKAEGILACSYALQRCRLVVSYGCSWLIHWMNCWQNSPEKKVMGMFQGSSWTVSIGTVIRAPHIKSISLDHRTFKNIPPSLRRDYWKSDSQEFWETQKMARKVAEGLGEMVCFRQTRNFGTMWDRTR